MYNHKRILGIIPARGGSVGVPKKNIRPLGGKPLIEHTFEQVKQVAELDKIVLSTDNEEIAATGHKHGVIIVKRPPELATGEAKTELALLHVLEALEDENPFDYVVVLEPTSPFRTPETISNCIRTIIDKGGESLVTLRETRSSLGNLTDGMFKLLNPDAPRRRQDRQPLYYESSTVYVCSVDHLKATGSLVCDHWLGMEVSEREAFDINTMLDFAIAEVIITQKENTP